LFVGDVDGRKLPRGILRRRTKRAAAVLRETAALGWSAMRGRRLLLVGVAAALCGPDLVQKASSPVYGHPRSAAYVALAACSVALLVAAVPRVPSVGLAVAAGVACAGVAGNAVSAVAWRGGVPNPIVVGDVAFNLADVYAVAGAALLVGTASLFALTHRELLHRPV